MGRGRKLENLNDFKRALKGKYGVGVGENTLHGFEFKMSTRTAHARKFKVLKPTVFTIYYPRLSLNSSIWQSLAIRL